ncbi:MAG: hypothetical protein L0323_06440 [Planctomycetes bacterium]|nr:hypothetical protein [Planctomycetota bacterium]
MSRASPALAGLLLAFACRAGPPRVPAVVPGPEERAILERADGLREEGDEEAALAHYRQAIGRSPFLVEAHRAVQEIRLDRLEKGALLAEYGKRVEEAPERPEPRYLLGRLLSRPQERKRAFEEAIERDPGFAFGHNGLAVVLREEGDLGGAEEAYRRAIECDPRLPEPRRGLVEMFLGDERYREALDEAREGRSALPLDGRLAALASLAAQRRESGPGEAVAHALDAVRSAPGDPGSYAALRLALEKRPIEEDLLRARLTIARGEGKRRPPDAEAERRETLGWIELRRGDPFAATAEYRSAVRGGDLSVASREELALSLLGAGQFREAGKVWLEGIPDSAGGEGSGALLAALDGCEAAPGNPEVLRALARLLLSTGRPRAARRVAGRLRALLPEDAGALSIATDCDRDEAFLGELAEILKRAARGRGPGTLGGFLEEVGRLSREILGEDVARGSRMRSYFPLGSILDPSPGAGGLPGWFAFRGRFAVFGRRTFGSPDGIVLRTVARRPIGGEILGRPFQGEVVLGDSREISPSRGGAGGDIAGAAVFDGYFVDLDAVRGRAAEIARVVERHGPRREAVFADPLPPCRTEADLLSIDEPLALAEKLLLRAEERRPGGWVERVLEAVEVHERAHLADAASLLPVGSHLLSVIGLLFRGGVSPSGVEAILEARAELSTLAACGESEIVLAGMVGAVESPGSRDPHAVGYRGVLEDLVRRIRDRRRSRREDWPGFRDDRNVYQQLDLVPPAVLREEARALATEEGLCMERRPEAPAPLLAPGPVR